MNFLWAGYEIINITCLVGVKEAGDPCARRCSNLQADETGNNESFTYGESSKCCVEHGTSGHRWP